MEQEDARSSFEALRGIFQAAVELDGLDQRNAFLDSKCGRNSEIRRKIEDLLDAHEQSNKHQRFLPDKAPRAGLEHPGLRIGRYTLVEQIGTGGYGSVWKAIQQRPLRREVALKIIKAGMDTATALARFDTERQALALMDHPHIAKVFDADSTETGRPYFVMELVAGVRITDFCSQNRLPIPRRVALLIKVCDAIQHAHEQGIIHRDIKPSNILVSMKDGEAVPKVIDFGIAKASGKFIEETPTLTLSGQFMGTPAYMSPEQAGGKNQPIDARTDIYSLGALLYELLTGQTTISQQMAFDQMLRLIREGRPARPSISVAALAQDKAERLAENCGTDSAALEKTLRGKLDWIIMTCLEKEPSQRYQDARSLARDLELYLAGKPLLHARVPSKLQRGGAWLGRHKAVALIACAMAVGVAIFMSTTHKRNSEWEEVPIFIKGSSAPARDHWQDIAWAGSNAWLVGDIDENGGGKSPHVGHGIMLHYANGESAWDPIKIENIASGTGTNQHFNDEVWTEAGPLTCIQLSKVLLADGKSYQTNGWISGVTGIYSTTNAGDLNARWERATPRPDGPDGFSRFSSFIGLENYSEIYAVGWQGISHWNGTRWQTQKLTLNYLINGIANASGEMWAVGGSAGDEYGRKGGLSHGAIYHLAAGSTNWETADLPGVHFFPGQILNDIAFDIRYAVLIAVGDQGMMLRGSIEKKQVAWKQISFGREDDIKSVACDAASRIWWAAGSKGLILKSSDQGMTWEKCTCFDQKGNPITQQFRRIRIYETAWIVGDGVLLRRVQPGKND